MRGKICLEYSQQINEKCLLGNVHFCNDCLVSQNSDGRGFDARRALMTYGEGTEKRDLERGGREKTDVSVTSIA